MTPRNLRYMSLQILDAHARMRAHVCVRKSMSEAKCLRLGNVGSEPDRAGGPSGEGMGPSAARSQTPKHTKTIGTVVAILWLTTSTQPDLPPWSSLERLPLIPHPLRQRSLNAGRRDSIFLSPVE